MGDVTQKEVGHRELQAEGKDRWFSGSKVTQMIIIRKIMKIYTYISLNMCEAC